MPNVVDKVKKTVADSLVRGAHKLWNEDNVESDISASDLATPPKPVDALGADSKLIKQSEDWYELSRQGRYLHNAEIFTGAAYFKGIQDSYYDSSPDGSGGMKLRVKGSRTFDRFYHKYANVCRTLVERAVARVTAQYPDAWAAPLTDSPEDKRAAQVARFVTAHASRVIRLPALLEKAALAMFTTSTVVIGIDWNNKAYADVGIPQADGTVSYHSAPIGEVCGSLRRSIEFYPDPNSALSIRGIHGGSFFITKEILPVSVVEHRYGVVVEATCSDGSFTFLEQTMSNIAGDRSPKMIGEHNSAVLTCCYNKPSPQYPKGRFWVYSGDTMCHKGQWPFEKIKDRYPFVEFYDQENAGSVWALNMVNDLLPIQDTLNKAWTKLAGILEWNVPVLFVPDNSEIQPDDLIDQHYGQTIPYKGEQVGGAKPTWVQPPDITETLLAIINQCIQQMEYIAGVRDFNSDGASAPNSTKEYELRMQEDKSRLAPVVRRMSEGVKEIYEWELALYEQFGASFPRLLSLDDQAIPQKALTGQDEAVSKLIDLTALKNGQYRVVLQPGSGVARLPGAQDERLDEVMELLTKLSPPQAQFYMDSLQDIRSDAQVDDLIAGMQKMYAEQQAMQPNPAQVAAVQAQSAQALQSQKLQFEQQQQQVEIEAQQAKDAALVSAEQEKAAIAVHATSLEQQFRLETDKQMAMLNFQHQMALQQVKGSQPSVSLTGALGKVGIPAAEKLAGFPETDSPDDMAKQLAPKPMAQGKGNNGGNSKNAG